MRLIAVALFAAAALCAEVKLTAVDESGYQKLVSSNKGKVVLVDFWATYCKPCRAETPKLVGMASRLRSKGLELITISADEPEQEGAAVRFITDMKVSGTPYIRRARDDDKFINSVDSSWNGALPALFLYDKRGRKVKSFVGDTPITEIEAAVGKLL